MMGWSANSKPKYFKLGLNKIILSGKLQQFTPVKSFLQAFVGVTSRLISLLPPRDRYSCILSTHDCKTVATLEEFNINSTVSELDSLGKLIQTCLEGKVSPYKLYFLRTG